MKQFIKLIAAIAILLCTSLLTTAKTYSGTSGDLQWSLDSKTGVLTITGNGEMGNYNGSWNYGYKGDAPWKKYADYIRTIDIRDGVTSVGAAAFYNCSNVTSVTIPSSVTIINYEAFRGCSSLETLTVPSGVTTIKDRWVTNCPKLKYIYVDAANTNYVSIGGIVYTADMKTIVKMPDNNPTTTYVIPDGIVTMATDAIFSQKNIVSVTIPESMKNIDFGVFDYCQNLTTLIFKALDAPKLGKALSGTNLKYVYVPCNQQASYSSGNWSSYASNMSESPVIDITVGTNDYDLGDVVVTKQADCETYEMKVTAVPTSIGRFVQWQDGTTDNPKIVTVEVGKAYSFEAQFDTKSYSISVEKGTTMIGDVDVSSFYSVSGGGTYEYGEMVQISATILQNGYVFSMWSDGVTNNPRTVVVNKNATYSALLEKDLRTVTIQSADETMGVVEPSVSNKVYNYGDSIDIAALPNKGYHFVKWSDGDTSQVRTITVSDNTVYQAYFAINQYEVAFLDENGDTLKVATYSYNETPSCDVPQKTNTAQYTYLFDTWIPAIASVTSVATYIASYTSVLNKYSVAFKNDDGTELQKSEWDYGTTPTYNGETPSKSSTAQYTYVFKGWSPEINLVSGVAEYTATYSSVLNKYFVVFKNDDGTELQKSEWDYGTTPTYNGETPSKSSTAQYTYVFKGWSPEINLVSDVAEYTATYSSVLNKYSVVFKNDDGTELQKSEWDYGTTPTYNGEIPSKSSTVQYTYEFKGWEPEIAEIVGNVEYTAAYTSILNSYTIAVSLNDEEHASIDGGGVYVYGKSVDLIVNLDDEYDFISWNDGNTDNPRTIVVEGNKSYEAVVKHKPCKVEVFVNNDTYGMVEGTGLFDYKSTVTLRAVPAQGYEFVSWNDGSKDSSKQFIVSGDTSLSVQFSIQKYTLSVSSNDLTMGIVQGSGLYEFNSNVEVSAKPYIGYVFVGWSDGNTNPVREISVQSDMAISAKFASEIVTITTAVNDKTIGSVAGAGQYEYNKLVKLVATPVYGYDFAGWADGMVDPVRYLIASEDACYTANFRIHKFSVKTTTNDVFMGAVEGGGNYEYQSEIDIVAVPLYGYEFVAWNDGNTDIHRHIVADTDKMYQAIFKPKQFMVDASVNHPEMGTVKGTGLYDYKMRTELQAIPNYGYRVQLTDGVFGGIYRLRVMNDTVVPINFELDEFKITVLSSDWKCSVVGGGIYDYMDTAVITAIPAQGYEFIQWSDGDVHQSRTVIVDANGTYEAEFKRIGFTDVHIYGSQNHIGVKNSDGCDIYVYSIDGKLEKEVTNCVNTTYDIYMAQKGIYVVEVINAAGKPTVKTVSTY